MSLFEPQTDLSDEETEPRNPRLSDFREKVRRALQGFDHNPRQPALEPAPYDLEPQPTEAYDVLSEVPPSSEDSRFPIGPIGYNRGAVDARVAALEAELQELREHAPAPISITEEIERLGEQTASILVVAHDQAHETARLAREQAERCVSSAESNAIAITEQAKHRLSEIDNETEAIWRERARLVEDARSVGMALVALADDATQRFPAEAKPPQDLPTLAT